jgi:sugar phosphate permease
MGDRMNLTYFVTFGMIGASISYCLIGLIGFSHSTTALYFLPVFMALNGVCQATQWPGKIL